MQLKNLLLAGAAALAFTLSTGAQAASSLAQCVSAPITQFDGTVVDAALATPELSTLVDAVVAADLVDALNDAEDITVYAPTNDAFAAIPADIAGAILADVDLLTSVLLYHVTPSIQYPRRFVSAERRNTLLGQYVSYSRADGEALVNNAPMSCSGVRTSNGIVWLLDSVLIPNF